MPLDPNRITTRAQRHAAIFAAGSLEKLLDQPGGLRILEAEAIDPDDDAGTVACEATARAFMFVSPSYLDSVPSRRGAPPRRLFTAVRDVRAWCDARALDQGIPVQTSNGSPVSLGAMLPRPRCAC